MTDPSVEKVRSGEATEGLMKDVVTPCKVLAGGQNFRPEHAKHT